MQDAPSVNVMLIDDSDPHGPYGAKGIVAVAAISIAPAILNIVYRASGVRIRQPFTGPDREFKGWGADAVKS